MSFRILLVFCFFWMSCKERPNYNPFDRQFDVSVNALIKDRSDTISAGCGFFNLQQNSGRFRTYYQVFIEDFDEVLAKGFNYYVDSISIEGKSAQRYYDSIIRLPFDHIKLKNELTRYNVDFLARDSNAVTLLDLKYNDTLHVPLYLRSNDENKEIYRVLHYFKGASYTD